MNRSGTHVIIVVEVYSTSQIVPSENVIESSVPSLAL